MKSSSAAALVAITIFILFVVIAIIITLSTVRGYVDASNGIATNISNRTDRIVSSAGGLDNALAVTVNNATTPASPAGAGAIAGTNYASTPQGSSVLLLTNVRAAAAANVTAGPNGKTSVIYLGFDAAAITISASQSNKVASEIIVANNTTGLYPIVVYPGVGVTINGKARTYPNGVPNPDSGVEVRPGTNVTFYASNPNVFVSTIPVSNRK